MTGRVVLGVCLFSKFGAFVAATDETGSCHSGAGDIPSQMEHGTGTQEDAVRGATLLQINAGASNDRVGSQQLCSYLKEALWPNNPTGHASELRALEATVNEWPLADCDLPKALRISREGERPTRTLSFTAVAQAESEWAKLPTGGILVAELASSPRSAVDDLIWQSVYQANTEEYFSEFTGLSKDIGLSGLQFAAYFPGHIVMQKADWAVDVPLSEGKFLDIAEGAGTDKIFRDHNYSMLYHRHLDTEPSNQSGIMLEIGLGCTMNYGAGASAKIWPKMFPGRPIHFIEINRACTEKWLPHMREVGVSEVHIGSQADKAVLTEVTQAAKSTPGGLTTVIDDGSHECDHIEASFRGLFPDLSHGGLYFVEDMMYSSWGTSHRQNITSKYERTTGTPTALAAALASAVVGTTTPKDQSLLGQQVRSDKIWIDNVTASYGGLVDFIECSPGICVFRRK